MPKPRNRQVHPDTTPYYHCVSRCVRRAFLCGTDEHSGQCYEHRRGWIRDKLLELGETFAIDICAYAVMSNHCHLVLHIDKESAAAWGMREVLERWHRIFCGNDLSRRYLQKQALLPAECQLLEEITEEWRKRLCDISWFMRVLNESIARKANEEDGCTGRFWEGRFKSQALLDEKALAACMAYVDLNPIRAGMAETPETSDYTSIQDRVTKAKQTHSPNHPQQQPRHLLCFAGNPRQNLPKGLPFRLTDYLELVDWTGRAILNSKKGFIPAQIPPILERIQIDVKHWLYMTQQFESRFRTFVGCAHKLKQICCELGYQSAPGMGNCKALFAR